MDVQGNVLASFFVENTGLATAATTDAQGNLIVAGFAHATDFPDATTFGGTEGTIIYLLKLDNNLSKTLATATIGRTSVPDVQPGQPPLGNVLSAAALAADSSGNVYVAGSVGPAGFPVTPNAFQTTPPKNDASGSAVFGFLLKLTPDLQTLAFSTYFGGNETGCVPGHGPCQAPYATTSVTALALDSSGEPVIAGYTIASDLPTTAGAYNTQCTCDATAGFAARFSTDGSKLRWSTYLIATNPALTPPPPVYPRTLGLDAAGNVVLGGFTGSGFPVTTGVIQEQFPNLYPAPIPPGHGLAGFVTKLDSTGAQLMFSTYFGGDAHSSAAAEVQSLVLAPDGSIWMSGNSDPQGLPGPPAQPLGGSYVAHLSQDGTTLPELITAPLGAAGGPIVLTATGSPVVLGNGSLLLPGIPGAAPILGIANAAADQASGSIAPGELISLYGPKLGPAESQGAQVADGVVSSSLAGYQVLFNGTPAPLLYLGANQINCVVPQELRGQDSVDVQIKTPQGTLSGPSLSVVASQPDIFHDANGNPYAINPDGTLVSQDHPATPGSIITLWATGAGANQGLTINDGAVAAPPLGHPSLPVSILSDAGGLPLHSLAVLYAGDAPGAVVGVLQVNLRLPDVSELNVSVSSLSSMVTVHTSVRIQLQVGTVTSASVSVPLEFTLP